MAHQKVYAICENKCQVETYDKMFIKNAFCKKSHASTTVEYGLGSETKYGHVKITTNVDTLQSDRGIALAQNAGYKLNQTCNTLSTRYGNLANRVLQLENAESEWNELPLADGISAGSVGRGTPQYKKIGNQVFIRGSVNVTALASGTVLIGTLPDECIPNAYEYSMQSCAGARIAQVFVNTNGELKLDAVYNLSDGLTYAGETWVQVVINYFVD